MQHFHDLKVDKIIRETPKAVSVVFEIPDDLKSDFNFVAGQYLTLKKEIEGEEIRRSYSICSKPQSGVVKVSVKEVKNGKFSTFINRHLKEGDSLAVHPPEGKFTFSTSEKPKNYAAFVAGSGITPVMSILKTALEEESDSKFVLVYGNRTHEETIYLKELLELQKQYPERFYLEFVYSRARDEQAFFGRIERSTVNFILKNKFKNEDFSGFYLCGPEPMIDTVQEVLIDNAVDKDKIHFELFKTSQEGEVDSDLEGETTIQVLVDDEEFEFKMNKETKVLDAVLDKDIDAPFSCQGGICSSCVAQLKEGKAEMEKNQILTDDEIEEGLILTCQAHPTTPKIIIDYDDV